MGGRLTEESGYYLIRGTSLRRRHLRLDDKKKPAMIYGERIPSRGTSQSKTGIHLECSKFRKKVRVAGGIALGKERKVENKVKCV